MTREEHDRARQQVTGSVVRAARKLRDASRSLLLDDDAALGAWRSLDANLRALDALAVLRMNDSGGSEK